MLMLRRMRLSQDTANDSAEPDMAGKMSFGMYRIKAITTRCMSHSQGADRCSMLQGKLAQKAAV